MSATKLELTPNTAVRRAATFGASETHSCDHLWSLKFAITAALQSPCQSKRGVVIWDGDGIISAGFNHLPSPFACDGSSSCRNICSRAAVHAEEHALLRANRHRLAGASMLHVKVIDGKPVPSGDPSCLRCASMVLESGIAHFWLLHEGGWHEYTAAGFYEKSGGLNERFVLSNLRL